MIPSAGNGLNSERAKNASPALFGLRLAASLMKTNFYTEQILPVTPKEEGHPLLANMCRPRLLVLPLNVLPPLLRFAHGLLKKGGKRRSRVLYTKP